MMRLRPLRLGGRLALFLAIAVAGPSAAWGEPAAPPPPGFVYERTLVPGAAGPNQLEVDVELLTMARPGGKLLDFRLFDAAGAEVPYLLFAPAPPTISWLGGVISPIVPAKKRSGFELDVRRTVAGSGLRLVGLPPPFLKRAEIEVSADRVRWIRIEPEALFFDLPDQKLVRDEVRFGPTVLRYLRVVWDDRDTPALPRPESALLRTEAQPAAQKASELRASVNVVREESEPGTSRFRLGLPAPALPVWALELDCGGTHLLRPARVFEPRLSGAELLPVPLGAGTLRRSMLGELSASDTRIAVEPPQGQELVVVVDDGANPPLALESVSAIVRPQPTLYFEAPGPAPLFARANHPTLGAPRYDLEAVRGALSERTRVAHAARWTSPKRPVSGAPAPAPALAAGDAGIGLPGAPVDAASFLFRRKLSGTRAGLVSLPLDSAVLAHARHELADVRLVDAAGRQIPYLVERRDAPLTLELPIEALSPPAGGPGHTRYRLRLPYAGLVSGRLTLSTAGRVFRRRVSVLEAAAKGPATAVAKLVVIGEADWVGADPAVPSRPLGLDLPHLDAAELVVDIDDGDNPPLGLVGARLALPALRLRFFRPEGEETTLLYGNPVAVAPKYDIALLSSRLLAAPAETVSLLAETERIREVPSKAPARAFWIALFGTVSVLLWLVAKLLRKPATQAKPDA